MPVCVNWFLKNKIYKEKKMDGKDKIELAVNAGLQLIPYVGSPLATLYFGAKQEKRLERIEKTLKEVAEDLKNFQLPGIEQHNKEELLSLIDELTDRIENEHLESKRQLYKKYIEKILITPTNGNYEERKIYLDLLNQVTPLQIELLVFLLDNPNVVDLSISKPGVDPVIIRSSILQLENYGLVVSRLHSITLGGNEASTPKYISVSELGKRFKSFCLE